MALFERPSVGVPVTVTGSLKPTVIAMVCPAPYAPGMPVTLETVGAVAS